MNSENKDSKMSSTQKTRITVQVDIASPLDTVWNCWTVPSHIVQWNSAIDTWHSPRAENDLRVGGKFSYRMEAKDGSMGFDFHGVYDTVKPNQYIEYTLGDGRKVSITFSSSNGKTQIVESFDAESVNSIEKQRYGWQSILNNFKKHVEQL